LKFFRKSLLSRIVGYFFILSSAIVILLGFISYWLFVKDLKSAVFERLEAVAAIKEDALNRWVDDVTRKLLQFSKLMEFKANATVLLEGNDAAPAYRAAYPLFEYVLSAMLEHNPEYQEIFLLTAKGGRIVGSTDKSSEGQYRVLDTFFIKGRQGTYVQNVYPSPLTLLPTMTVSTPVIDEKGEVVGVLAANLNMERMDEIINDRTGLGKSGESYLVDRYNILVSGKRFGSETFPRGVHSRGIENAVGGSNGSGIYDNYMDVPVLGVYKWIRGRDVALLVEIHTREIFQSARNRILTIAVIGVGLVLLLAWTMYLVAKRIARPILAVKEAALEVAEGNLEAKAPVLTQDEVGVLAKSFNRMTEKVKSLYDELAESEEHFRSLIESSSDIIAVIDRKGKFKFISPSVERVLGYKPDELKGRELFALVHPDDLDRIKCDVIPKLLNGGTQQVELFCRGLHRNKSWRTLEVAERNLLDNPAVAGIVVNVRDVTARMEVERALRESEEKYRSFFEEDLTGDYTATPDGAIISCNPAFARIMGFATVVEVRRHRLTDFYADPNEYAKFIRLLGEKHKLEYYEKEMRNVRGDPVYVIENAIGKFDGRGEIVELKGYLFDNTERKQLEEKLRHVQKMEAVARLAGGIAHDFNNLLTAIMGYSEIIMLRPFLDGETAEDVREIKKAADRAASLTQQLLAYSRKQVLQPKLINLNRLILGIENLLRRLIGEDIALRTKLDPKLSMVKADPGQIEQVLMNLIVNSRDAMPGGGEIAVGTQTVALGRDYCLNYPEVFPGTYVHLSVRDTGCGMDEKTIEKIFDPFFTTKELGKGTGLGLSTVFGIVKQSGGHITVQSAPGSGTVFNIYIPEVPRGCAEESGSEGAAGVKKGNETILLVEDEEAVRKIISRCLTKSGYHVYEADNPIDALRMREEMNGQRIDLLITDVVMPHMDGKKLSEKLLKHQRDLKVLFVSGYTDDAIVNHGVLEDDLHFLQKPFAPDDLALKVREVLDG